MSKALGLDEVLDAAEQLDPESQAELAAVLNRRLSERGRMKVLEDVLQGRKEFAEGKCKPKTARDILREALE